jgi:hypothetical protein
MSEPSDNEKKETWITRTAAVLAVLAALSNGGVGSANLKSLLVQSKVNNEWAYYQAKSTKEHVVKETATLARALHVDADAIASLDSESSRLDSDKNDAEKIAHNYEEALDRTVESSFWYEVSFGLLQLGVVLCTLAAGTKRRSLWITAITFGLLGLVLYANGQRLFYRAPTSWYKIMSKDADAEAAGRR